WSPTRASGACAERSRSSRTRTSPDDITLFRTTRAFVPVADVHVRPDTARVEVPPIDGPLSLEGDTVGTLPFASRAPAWSHTRFGLEQVLDEGATKVGWWAVAAT